MFKPFRNFQFPLFITFFPFSALTILPIDLALYFLCDNVFLHLTFHKTAISAELLAFYLSKFVYNISEQTFKVVFVNFLAILEANKKKAQRGLWDGLRPDLFSFQVCYMFTQM